jgi:hypothetical protein
MPLLIKPEEQSGKQSLFLPTNMQPLQRSLLVDRPTTQTLFPKAPTVGPVGMVLVPDFRWTKEVPFFAGQANSLPLAFAAGLWLDDPNASRKLKGRRGVTLINEDPANPVRFAFADGAAATGAIIHPAQNISFPADEHVNVYAQATVLAGSQISILQWA